jgi:YrbI family 3-deoxy-D-manno-octulosonate 8-phosphate phosphatase
MAPADLEQRLARIRVLFLDVDGVLTDGRIWITPRGEEWKVFSVRDGAGIRLALETGLEIVLVTGRSTVAVDRRAEELGIRLVLQGVREKGVCVRELCEERGWEREDTAAVGDDLADLPMFAEVAFSFAVADAAPEVRQAADLVLERAGGQGAVREAVELILRAQGHWERLVAARRGAR